LLELVKPLAQLKPLSIHDDVEQGNGGACVACCLNHLLALAKAGRKVEYTHLIRKPQVGAHFGRVCVVFSVDVLVEENQAIDRQSANVS